MPTQSIELYIRSTSVDPSDIESIEIGSDFTRGASQPDPFVAPVIRNWKDRRRELVIHYASVTLSGKSSLPVLRDSIAIAYPQQPSALYSGEVVSVYPHGNETRIGSYYRIPYGFQPVLSTLDLPYGSQWLIGGATWSALEVAYQYDYVDLADYPLGRAVKTVLKGGNIFEGFISRTEYKKNSSPFGLLKMTLQSSQSIDTLHAP